MIYDSIDNCPIGIFHKISENGDLSLLIKEGDYPKKDLEKAWNKIYNEVIEDNGIPENYSDAIKYRIKALEQFNLAYNDNQRFRITLGQMALLQARELLKSTGEKNNFNDTLAQLSKAVGFRLDKNIITISEYLAYLRIL